MALGQKTGGRQAGTPNKATMAAKEAFQHAFDAIGGAEQLAEWARDNTTDFYKLYGRLIPLDLNHGAQDSLTDLLNAVDGRSRKLPG